MTGIDQTPWICPSCAHFTVRVGEASETPKHDCGIAGATADLVPYVDSDQAVTIRHNTGRASFGQPAARSIG